MRREIKFRAFYDGFMYKHVEMTTYSDGSNCCTMIGHNMQTFISPDYDSIISMQYINLDDVDHKEVYESDIVSAYIPIAGFTIQGVVMLDKGCWSIKVHDNAETIPLFGCKNIRVLGNIHEHPELLTPH